VKELQENTNKKQEDTSTPQEHTTKITMEDNQICKTLYGQREAHLRILEESFGVVLRTRGNELEIEGAEAARQRTQTLLQQLYETIKRGFAITAEDVRKGAAHLLEDEGFDLSKILTDTLLVSHRGKRITPRGYHQKLYVDAIRRHDLVFGIGPAGTGKTYLAMAMAIAAYQRKEVEKIILTRPAVEAGERLGFLPGSLQEKVNPYLRPLYDALHDMVELERAEMMLSRGIVEVAPLAFMRGRTLNNAFVILDEAQNTSPEQMKMFLTRLGFDSKAVVTGDVTQVDLPSNTRSGLIETLRILRGVEGIYFSEFDERDVVRHPLVQRIIVAYGRAEEEEAERRAKRRAERERLMSLNAQEQTRSSSPSLPLQEMTPPHLLVDALEALSPPENGQDPH
jgi:phosphate starvation-inducible PhoH-like protein